MNRAVFLDRDGTMIEDVGYLDRLQRLKLFPYTVDAIRLLNRAGFKIVVVTSQAGIANGVITEAFVKEAHEEISRRAGGGGGRIDAYYYCPHSTTAVVDAVPHRVRLPQAEARYDTQRPAGPVARSQPVVRRRRSLARYRNGAGGGRHGRPGGDRVRQDGSVAPPREHRAGDRGRRI